MDRRERLASECRYSGRPLTSLQGLDTYERTIYVGTLNKAPFSGLRTGYLIVPERLLERFVTTRYLMDRKPPDLQQEVLAASIGRSHLTSHIRRMRDRYRDQRDRLVDVPQRRAGDFLENEPLDQGCIWWPICAAAFPTPKSSMRH